jgi:hypothetical protein
VDRIEMPLGPSTTKATPIGLTGEVRMFWTQAKFRPPGYTFDFSAECQVLIQVQRADGSPAWAKEYSKKSTDSFRESPNLDAIAGQSVNRLALVLGATVEEAVNDPEFVQAIRQRRPWSRRQGFALKHLHVDL